MAILVEYCCDNSRNDSAIQSNCLTRCSNGPMAMANADTPEAVAEVLRVLDRKVTADGWKRHNGGWWCPNCSRLNRD